MEIWKNKVVVVTGAGQGIGAQITEYLVRHGMYVIGFEPSEDTLNQILSNIRKWGKVKGMFIPCKCDISNDNDLKHAFEGIINTYGGVDLLINNAAVGREGLICTSDINDMKDVINVNIYGMIACTRLAIDSMIKKSGKGQIINMNSICGHYMPAFSEPKTNMYIASKKAMTTFNKKLQSEFRAANINIKLTSISPGIVKTNLFKNSNLKFINDEFFEKNPHLTTKDVANIVLMILKTPRNIVVKDIIFHALHEIY